MNRAEQPYWWEGGWHKIPKRDTQKAKLYAAERIAFGRTFAQLLDGKDGRQGHLDDVMSFVRQVESSATWLKLLAKSHLKPWPGGLAVQDGRGCRMARGGRSYLVLPMWARTKPVILHEMAHSATPGAGHGWPFAAAFLVLVGQFLGAQARDALKASFRKGRVRFTPPRKFSAEHMAKLRAHGHKLAAMRRGEVPNGETGGQQ